MGVNAVAIVQTQTHAKGAVLWPGPSFLPGIGLTFFERFSVEGLKFVWSQFDRQSPYHLKMSFYRFDDGSPWISLSHAEEGYRNQREGVWEASLEFRYQFGLANQFYVGALISRAVNGYDAAYGELQLAAPVWPYAQLELSLGWMPEETALYYYGVGAEPGLSHVSAELSHIVLKLPWAGIWKTGLTYSRILQGENQQARFIRGQKENIALKSLFVWKLF